MKNPLSTSRGFTLIELLIVIAIIAILSGILITSLTGSKAKSRDGKRVSDVAQIQLAVEQYFDRCQQYPPTITGPLGNIMTSGCPTGITLGSFISKIPATPTGGAYEYYINDGTFTDYILHTVFETNNAAVTDSLTTATKPSWATNIQCNDSSHALDYCVGSK